VIRAVALVALLALGQPARLAVRTATGAIEWWRADQAPSQWSAPNPVVTSTVQWHRGTAGVTWGELSLAGDGEALRTRVIVARLDPRRVKFGITWGVDADARPRWSLDDAPADARVAGNAGHFVAALPWGWVVASGRERLAPGHGPLSSAFIVRRDGSARIVDGDTLGALRRDSSIVAAFQSYPSLLVADGIVPAALRAPCAIDCGHRDARLALGITRDGMVLVAMTRFDAAGTALGFIPLGLTVPEMAALMGALGARQAMLLDGGISAQMMVRDAKGAAQRWRGVRRVPLALWARE
jgi:uncharacterized protein YigE (DUF2233 family)